ncbi:recombinase family protein [Cytobacillus oceanisediminis]|uniref:recombinase family protein n=1 Tax=Cytobacillus oceanisediminis TaxID=665099 RepID=UPI002041E345|nr:recombinase family protein [Cytobacillus oceanisediminis]MCM3405476.1 recombinase family protein [Cytobacillus oceanisediminis]
MKIGYARVSSQSQNLARQIEELKNYGCEYIFEEKVSGKNFDRPEYKRLRKKLRFGDILVVHDLSRFGRNKEEIMSEWKSLVDDNIDIVVLNLPVLNTAQYKDVEGIGKLVSDIFLSVMSWLVEEERLRIKTAQRQGIDIAKKKGKYKGREIKYRPDTPNPTDRLVYETIVDMLNRNESVMDIHRRTGVARMTIYRIKKELKETTKGIK